MMTDGQGDDDGDGVGKSDYTGTHLGAATAIDYDAKEILADGRREMNHLPVGKGDAVVKCLPLLPGCAWKHPRAAFTTWPTLVRDGYLVGGLLLVHVVSSHWLTLHRRLGHRASHKALATFFYDAILAQDTTPIVRKAHKEFRQHPRKETPLCSGRHHPLGFAV